MAVNKVIYGTTVLVDLTEDTVTPSTLMQGYTAHDKSGALITGTATGGTVTQDANGFLVLSDQGGGGGTTTLKMGVIRPDAELVQSWSYDKQVVEDLGLTIPAYSTSTTTLVSAENLSPIVSCDLAQYDYYITIRWLTYPIYASGTTKAGGMQDYSYCVKTYEAVHTPKNKAYSLDGTSTIGYNAVFREAAHGGIFYWSGSAPNFGRLISNSPSYGVYCDPPSSFAFSDLYPSGLTLTVSSPALRMRGSSSYYNQTFWEATEDIRYQWVIEIWRSKKGDMNLDGWGLGQMNDRVLSCANSQTHTLT